MAFLKGIWGFPILWKLWIGMLMMVNLVIPIAFFSFSIAKITMATFMLCSMIGMAMAEKWGFNRLLGLMHAPWVVLNVYLWMQRSFFIDQPQILMWIYSVILLNSLSLIIDAVDVVRYFRGSSS